MAVPDDARRRPIVLAHRGGSGLAPENTLEAFRTGLACGADGIELDVRLSCDGIAVVFHDETLDRTTDGRGAVASLTADELGVCDAGYRFARDGRFPWRGRGCRIPRLRDVLSQVMQPALIEIKAPSAELTRVVIDDVRRADADARVWIGSFHDAVLDDVRRLAPHIRRGANPAAILAAATGQADARSVDPGFSAFQVPESWDGTRIVSPAFVGRAHDLGAPVFVWTVDALPDVERLLDWGVDGILTDRPDVVVPAVRARGRRAGRGEVS